MLATGTWTTHPHGGRKESLVKGLINLRLPGRTYAGQIREKRKKKKAVAEFAFPFVGKHKTDFAGYPRGSVTTTTDKILVNVVVHRSYCMASNITLFRKLATEYTTEQSSTEWGRTTQEKGDGTSHHKLHYSVLELTNKFQFFETKGTLNQAEVLPVSVQETEPQNLFICQTLWHSSLKNKQTSPSETTPNSPLHQNLIFL